jgi:hypothetical protein
MLKSTIVNSISALNKEYFRKVTREYEMILKSSFCCDIGARGKSETSGVHNSVVIQKKFEVDEVSPFPARLHVTS